MYGIYRCESTGLFYQKTQAGVGRYRGMYLWQPVKKLCFWYVKNRDAQAFWLDDLDFELVTYPFSMRRAVFELPAKARLMRRRGYYKTLSGDWRDNHAMYIVTKDVFRRLSLEELERSI